MVLDDHLANPLGEVDVFEHRRTDLGMFLYELHLGGAETPGPGKDLGRDHELTEVVNSCRQVDLFDGGGIKSQFPDGDSEVGDTLLVAGGVGIARFDRLGQRVYDFVR